MNPSTKGFKDMFSKSKVFSGMLWVMQWFVFILFVLPIVFITATLGHGIVLDLVFNSVGAPENIDLLWVIMFVSTPTLFIMGMLFLFEVKMFNLIWRKSTNKLNNLRDTFNKNQEIKTLKNRKGK